MDIRKISQLAQLMSAHDLSEISFESADVKLLLKRGHLAEALATPLRAAAGSTPAATPAGWRNRSSNCHPPRHEPGGGVSSEVSPQQFKSTTDGHR